MSFSTYNESSLHKTLKTLYAEKYSGQTEVPLNNYIYDIITKEKNIIEIQTKNLSQLYGKIEDAILRKTNIKIVHPIPVIKIIETYDSSNNLITKRKSPVKGSIYSIFKELTKIYPFLLNEYFSLDVMEIIMIEKRLKTEEAVQTKNKKRRFKKDWIKTDKQLKEIITARTFNNKKDYTDLLPEGLPDPFCAKDLQKILKENKLATAEIYKNINLITWVLSRINIISEKEIKNRNHYFSINKINK